MKVLTVVTLLFMSLILESCAVNRAMDASQAKTDLIGMSKDQILSCMGAPVREKGTESVEVWSYDSGGSAVHSSGRTAQRYCIVDIVFSRGYVANLNYIGPTGGLLTGDEQCAYAIENCLAE